MCRGYVRRMRVLGLEFRLDPVRVALGYLLAFENFERLTFRFYRHKLV